MRDELAKAMDAELIYWPLAREFYHSDRGDLMAKYRLSFDDVCYLERKAWDKFAPYREFNKQVEEERNHKQRTRKETLTVKRKDSFWHRWFPSRATAMKRELDYRKKLGYDR